MTIRHTPLPVYSRHPISSAPGALAELFQNFVDNPRQWVDNRTCVLLWGPEGAGKSSIIGAVHKALADQRRLVYWVDCDAWPDDYDESDDLKNQLANPRAHIVIWDDLGKEPANTRGDVRDAIKARHRFTRGVDIFSTNLTMSPDVEDCDLTKTYGASFRSRVAGLCGDYVIHYQNPDRRIS